MAFPGKQTASPTQGYQQKNVHDMKASRIYLCFALKMMLDWCVINLKPNKYAFNILKCMCTCIKFIKVKILPIKRILKISNQVKNNLP